MTEVLKSFKNDGFYTITKNNNDKYSISKLKITQEQYNESIKILERLNQYGEEFK